MRQVKRHAVERSGRYLSAGVYHSYRYVEFGGIVGYINVSINILQTLFFLTTI